MNLYGAATSITGTSAAAANAVACQMVNPNATAYNVFLDVATGTLVGSAEIDILSPTGVWISFNGATLYPAASGSVVVFVNGPCLGIRARVSATYTSGTLVAGITAI